MSIESPARIPGFGVGPTLSQSSLDWRKRGRAGARAIARALPARALRLPARGLRGSNYCWDSLHTSVSTARPLGQRALGRGELVTF